MDYILQFMYTSIRHNYHSIVLFSAITIEHRKKDKGIKMPKYSTRRFTSVMNRTYIYIVKNNLNV